jgi:hypothetical protein
VITQGYVIVSLFLHKIALLCSLFCQRHHSLLSLYFTYPEKHTKSILLYHP